MPRKIARYGWRPQLPDIRDQKYAAPAPPAGGLPPLVDMRAHCPAVYDQGQLGSCTANAIGAAFEFDQIKEKAPHVWRPSRLFIYYNERAIEGTVGQDAGANIRDGIKSVVTQGACSEDLWTYDDGQAKFQVAPPKWCYDNAAKHLVTSYQAVAQDIGQIKGCVASGYPMIFGFTVYDSFESQAVASSGILAMPGPSEQVVGGHAVLCVGYNDTMTTTNPDGSTSTGSILVRNSWAATWGEKGYFWMPYDYITNANLSSDFWTLRMVEWTPKS
jgi:C1A family cysteine protease